MEANRSAAQDVSAVDPAAPYRRVRHLTISKRDGQPGAGPTYFVRTSTKQVYQFGEEEHLLCQLVDGRRSFPEIQSEFRRQIGAELTRAQFEGFITEMLECGIVEPLAQEQSLADKPIDDGVKALEDPKALKVELTADADQPVSGAESADLPLAEPRRFAVRLCDPAAPLRAVDWLAGPLRFYRWMLLPAALACLIAMALSTTSIGADLSRLSLGGAGAILVVALLVVGVVPPVAQAAMASFLGLPARDCGVDFRFGLLPRLRFSDADWGELRAMEALCITGAPVTVRLALFAAGTGGWLLTRQSGGWLPVAWLIGGQVALCATLVVARPFAATPARQWLTTLFGRSELWRSGGFYRAQVLALSGLWALACAGLALLYLRVAAHVDAGLAVTTLKQLPAAWGPFAASTAATVGAELSRLGPAIDQVILPLLTIVPVAGWLWLRGAVKSQTMSRVVYLPEDRVPSARALAPKPPGVVVPLSREVGLGGPAGRRRQAERWPSKSNVVVAVIAAICVALAFVPYPYEAGGNFTILPNDSSKLNARIQGELTEVMVNEGDRVVPGQILGILSDWDEQANLDVSKAQLENAKASLETLYQTPKPEDVELARKQYELAISKIPYDKAQYERAAVLVKTDAVSRSQYDQILSQYQQDQAAADVARANYDDVRAGPTPAQFDQARAVLRQAAAAVAYNEDQLERTRIRATSYGEVVTPNPMLLRGQWYPQGALVFTVQDLSTVQADVQVPENDIGHVQLGGVTRLRAWAFPEKTFLGQAIAIAGDAQQDPSSGTNIVRVRTEVPNPDGALHPTMTGYAKITGPYMPAWKASMLMIVRFCLIQVWSFVP